MVEQTGSKKEDVLTGRVGFRPVWLLYVSISVRAVHQLFAAFILAGFFFSDTGSSFTIMVLASFSGVVLLFTEAARHRQIYREITGVVMFGKLVLLGLIVHSFIPQSSSLVFVFLISSFISHAPKTIRHRLLF